MKNAVPQILEEPDSKTDIEHIRLKIEDCEVVHVADDNNTSLLLEPKSDEPEYAPASDTESEVHTNEDQEEEANCRWKVWEIYGNEGQDLILLYRIYLLNILI